MVTLTPEQMAAAINTAVEGVTYGIITQKPETLPGFQSLGASLLSIAKGTGTPIEAEQSLQLLLKELGLFTDPLVSGIAGFLDGAVNNFKGSQNIKVPTTGIINDILTNAGNGVTAACTLYVANNPPTPMTVSTSVVP